MKKVFVFIVAVLSVFFVNINFLNSAEAARVAVVPIQIDETQVERVSDLENYYWDVMVDKFKYPDYELMDDEKLVSFVPEGGIKSYDEATLADLCNKAEAEIIVAMRLDKVKEKPLNYRREPMISCFMQGEFASYNRLTGKYYNKKLYYKGTIEEVLTLRTDWQQQVFASELKRNINRTLEAKEKK